VSTLPLFMPEVFTDDPDNAFTANHPAIVAHALDGSSYFHDLYLFLPRRVKPGDDIAKTCDSANPAVRQT